MKIDFPIGKETHLRIEWHFDFDIRKVVHGQKAIESLHKIEQILNTEEADG